MNNINLDTLLNDTDYLNEVMGWASYLTARNAVNAKYPDVATTCDEACRRDRATHRLKQRIARKIDINDIREAVKVGFEAFFKKGLDKHYARADARKHTIMILAAEHFAS